VVGQTAIHLRDRSEDEYQEIAGQFVDVDAAAELLAGVADGVAGAAPFAVDV